MIVARDHVLRAQVQKGSDVRAGDGFEEVGIASGDGVGPAELTGGEKKQKNRSDTTHEFRQASILAHSKPAIPPARRTSDPASTADRFRGPTLQSDFAALQPKCASAPRLVRRRPVL